MVQVKCDKCGRILHEPIFRLIMTDGAMTKEAQFCEEHAQKMHDAVMKYASYTEDVKDDGMDIS
jgi:hypothetical protein